MTSEIVAAGTVATGNVSVPAVAGLVAGVATIGAVRVKHSEKEAEYSVVAANEVAFAAQLNMLASAIS
jgi:hypothetical protein